MKTFILDIIPKIQRFSQKLDNITTLTNKHWVIIDENIEKKVVYIFREKENFRYLELTSSQNLCEPTLNSYLINEKGGIIRKDIASTF